MRTLRGMVIGAGGMGGYHASILSGIPGVELAAVVDVDKSRAERLARLHNAEAFTDSSAAIRRKRPDFVFITTSTPFHAPYSLQAEAAGIAVFCEKPLARNVRDGEKVVSRFRKSKVPFTVGLVLRLFPEYVKLRELARNGTLGDPAVIRTSRGGGFPRASKNWYSDFRQSGGPLLDMGIHDIDWLIWTFGPVERVHAREIHRKAPVESAYSLAVLRHKCGAIAHVETYWGHSLPFRTHVEAAGSKSLLDYDSAVPPAVELVESGRKESRPGVAVPESPLAQSPFELEDVLFIESLRSGSPPAVSAEDALEALRAACACLDSIRTGKAVKIR